MINTDTYRGQAINGAVTLIPENSPFMEIKYSHEGNFSIQVIRFSDAPKFSIKVA